MFTEQNIILNQNFRSQSSLLRPINWTRINATPIESANHHAIWILFVLLFYWFSFFHMKVIYQFSLSYHRFSMVFGFYCPSLYVFRNLYLPILLHSFFPLQFLEPFPSFPLPHPIHPLPYPVPLNGSSNLICNLKPSLIDKLFLVVLFSSL